MRGTIRDWKTLAKTRNSSSHTFFLWFFVSLFLSVSRSTASSALRSNPLYLCLRSNANPSPPVLTSLSFSLLQNDPSCRKTSTTNRTFLVWLWNKRIQQKLLKRPSVLHQFPSFSLQLWIQNASIAAARETPKIKNIHKSVRLFLHKIGGTTSAEHTRSRS